MPHPPLDRRSFLLPETAARLNNLSLFARLAVEGYIIGLHRSPYHGFSVEFAEHRLYGAGDEVKHLDWKLFGKTDRYYVKRFEEETNLRCHLLLDVSRSMTYSSGSVSKLDYGKFLCAALTYLMLRQQDAVSLTLFDTATRDFVPARSKPSHLDTVLSCLQSAVPGGETRLAPPLHHLAGTIRQRGLIILVSDLLDDPAQVLTALKHFRHEKHEVVVFHLLDRQELEYEFASRTKFRDTETGEEITTEPWQIRSAYKKVAAQFVETFRSGCRKRRIDYALITTAAPLDKALGRYLEKRKRIG